MQKVITVFGNIVPLIKDWKNAYHEYPEINNHLAQGYNVVQIIPTPIFGVEGAWGLTVKMDKGAQKQKVITAMGTVNLFGSDWPNVYHEYPEVNKLISQGCTVAQIVPAQISGPDGAWVLTFVLTEPEVKKPFKRRTSFV